MHFILTVSIFAQLQNVLKATSEGLHASLDGRLSFASFDIILPSSWSNDCVANTTVTSYSGIASDVTITNTNQLWTQQSSGCGEMGDQIFAGYGSIESDDDVADRLVDEWMKFRFGVFDLRGFQNDSIYAPCGSPDAQKLQVCNDAFNLDTDEGFSFTKHNRYLPSKQNFICQRQSPIDVIMKHEDFLGSERNQPLTSPTFNYVRKTLTRYVVIIDDHIDINVRDSFQFLRDSMRKWIEKDLNHDMTEVGIMMMGNSNETVEAERRVIKSLRGSDDREEIFSTLPWYIDRKNNEKCMTNNAVRRAIRLMKERARSYGDAHSVIVIISPGMSTCSDNVTGEMIASANDANIKITTINYPNIGPNRIEMDQLAYKTGGQAYTVVERKQNEQQSLLSTFFELTNTLMQISFEYAAESDKMPVEIYRKELIDNGSREENRPTFDSFNVDAATQSINYFVYIYDRKERNIEKGMKLISPNNQEFATSSELRAEYHQLTIVGNLTSRGSWTYYLKRFFGNPQPHYVQVMATPKPDNQNFIRAKAWIKRPKNGGPLTIFTQVMQGNLAIQDAFVEVSIQLPNGRVEKQQLFDTGSGDPDLTKGDGIYTRYFATSMTGQYRFQIFVTDRNVAFRQQGELSLIWN